MSGLDLKAVMEVEHSSYEFPWTLPIFRDCLRVGCYCFVYETLEHGIIGHGIMSVAAGECHLLNICIHPEFQRQGLGEGMVLYLLDFARKKKARVALLEVRISNTAAYKLYIKLGFDEVGLRKSYYPAHHGREDAIILARDLTIST
ncbi:MAG: ribosomal protein S18-alanine N-acetyltransferase [Gammaproteobacteria bacterium]|nr:ribosomal protein S18-alanine N-acetyltransferase [Gammaproteobacteria bacterium]MDH3369799.1 ribosomal protein S18-alanine N-acetyltransferase [Gammaproteobacteria bacterium]MDH3406273.1 ribosomal protein S18-alanine N-acetyltransferase [Gammaproteobacteria bacterium]MDH3562647.1 ribosomal protein S18-alanine N-acetyltransferase [Gammaproteobacteria bacterium]MDH5487344.1 ribosomal protein S18-alanine N-acetyltransferase [Gammaproteobacteria bacterium]